MLRKVTNAQMGNIFRLKISGFYFSNAYYKLWKQTDSFLTEILQVSEESSTLRQTTNLM